MDILKAVGLKKYYTADDYEVRALDGVTFSVEDGEFIAIVGTSGSGKTTLLNMLGGLDVPTEGGVWIRGSSLKDMGSNIYPFWILKNRSGQRKSQNWSSLFLTGKSDYRIFRFSRGKRNRK